MRLRMVMVSSLLLASMTLAFDPAGASHTCAPDGVGRWNGTVTRGSAALCRSFSVGAFDAMVVSVDHAAGSPYLSAWVENQYHEVVGDMQYFRSPGSKSDLKACVPTFGGEYSVHVQAVNVEGTASFSVSIDTSSSASRGNVYVPPFDIDGVQLGLNAVVLALNAGTCGPYV